MREVKESKAMVDWKYENLKRRLDYLLEGYISLSDIPDEYLKGITIQQFWELKGLAKEIKDYKKKKKAK